MNKDFVEYSYTIPLEYIRNTKKVPCFLGELGIHVSNFEKNAFGIEKGENSGYSISWKIRFEFQLPLVSDR